MRIFRITTNATTELTDKPFQMSSLRLVVTGTPSAWVIKVQNKEAPPKVFYVSDGLSATATIQVPFPQHGERTAPVPMAGGIDVVTAGTTPATLDVWIDGQKANQ